MIGEILTAGVLGTLPVATFTFLMLQWTIASGRVQPFKDAKDLRSQIKEQANAKKEAKKKKKADKEKNKAAAVLKSDDTVTRTHQPDRTRLSWLKKPSGGDIFHNKMMSFGGGFYGTMAILTYVLIEAVEIAGFIGKIFDPANWNFNVGIDLLVGFLINSIKNFVSAMLWFTTLPDFLPVTIGWVWLIAAYLGYLVGVRVTIHRGNEVWEKLAATANRSKAWVYAQYSTASGDHVPQSGKKMQPSDKKHSKE